MAVTRAALASTISAVTGLDVQVAINWLNAENSVVGHGTNPLGILCGNSRGSGLEVGCDGRFAIYRSSTDGARAAGWLLLHGPYAGVRQAIATGTPQAQRAAIVRSPWAFGNYHNGDGFSAAGISGSAPAHAGPLGAGATRAPTARLVSAPPVGGPPKTGAASASTATFDCAAFQGHLLRLGIPNDAGHQFTPDEALKIATLLYGVRGDIASTIAGRYSGRTVGDVCSGNIDTGSNDPLGIGEALRTFSKGLPGLAANIAVLVTILVLGYLGVRALLG